MNSSEKPGIAESIQDVVRNLGDVVQNELRLAKAESAAAIKSVTGGLVTFAAGLAFLIPALTLLGMAGADMLAEQTAMVHWVAGSIVGVAFAVLGFVLIQAGRKAMTSSHATLPTTTNNIKQDVHVLKESIQ